MNELKIFTYGESPVRTVLQDGEPWWVLKDVCEVLEMDTTQLKKVADRLDGDEKGRTQITTPGGTQNTWIVNESGLYKVILRSDKPEAKKFTRWVTHEVLPSIRKHGAYMTPETLEQAILSPDYLLKVVTALKDETDKRKALEAQAEKDKPKVIFADAVSASHSSILVGELAKLLYQNGIDMGQNRLFAWLREKGYLIKRQGSDYNMPTQQSMERGWFTIKETAINHSNGSVSVSKTVKVTGKGQQYFVSKFLSEEKEGA